MANFDSDGVAHVCGGPLDLNLIAIQDENRKTQETKVRRATMALVRVKGNKA